MQGNNQGESRGRKMTNSMNRGNQQNSVNHQNSVNQQNSVTGAGEITQSQFDVLNSTGVDSNRNNSNRSNSSRGYSNRGNSNFGNNGINGNGSNGMNTNRNNLNMMSNLFGLPFSGMNMNSINGIANTLLEGNGMGDLFNTLSSMSGMNRNGRNNGRMPMTQSGQMNQSFRADVIDRGGFYELRAELPGYEKQEIQVEVGDASVVIGAAHREKSMEDRSNYLSKECLSGSVSRSFALTEVRKEEVEARFHAGVLYMKLPKVAATSLERRIIEIK